MKKLLILVLVVPLLFDCTSKLHVKVGVLQSSYLTNNSEVLEARSNVFQRKYFNSSAFKDIENKLIGSLSENLIQVFKSGGLDESTKNTILQKGQNVIKQKVTNAKKQYEAGIDKLKDLEQKKDKDKITFLKEALMLFEAGDVQLLQIIDEVTTAIDQLKSEADKNNIVFNTALSNFAKETSNVINTVVLNPLFDDPMTPIVVNGGKKHWKGKTNQVKAQTFIGNTDIAIVMESPGEYSLKGIRNDASQATKAIFTVANITIQALAKAYGVGLKPVSATDSNTYFAQIQVTRNELEKAEKVSQKALVDIFQTILNEEPNITSDTTQVRRSLNRIGNIINIKKEQLNK